MQLFLNITKIGAFESIHSPCYVNDGLIPRFEERLQVATRIQKPQVLILENVMPAFLTGAKSENTRVFEVSAHAKDPQVDKIKPEPSTTACFVACVASAR